jgi:hypothetical protein
MEITPVAVLLIPLKVHIPVVVVPSVPVAMELAVLVLPMVFDEMMTLPVPVVLMP